MKRILLLLGVTLLASCTDELGARRALESQGFRQIEITGYRYWGCAESDNFHTGFQATGAGGDRVAGVVCKSLTKGSTVRID